MDIREKFESEIRGLGIDPASSRVLLAVSGGPDSMVLLHVARQVFAQNRGSVVVAHFHHGFRPDEEHAEELVREAALEYGLPFVVGHGSLSLGPAEEIRARMARYKWLVEAARANGCPYIFTAHTRSDQAETLLLHLLRGAGGGGLKGIASIWPLAPGVSLIRPFLSCPRSRIEEYITSHGIATHADPTNAEDLFLRNEVRHDLLPMCERLFPGVEARLGQTAEVLRADDELLDQLAQAEADKVVRNGPGFAVVAVALGRSPVAISRRVLKMVLPSESGFRHVEAARALLARAGAVHLPGDVRAVRVGGGLIVGAPVSPPASFQSNITLTGEVFLSEVGLYFRAEKVGQFAGPCLTPWETDIPLRVWDRGVCVRSRKPGDLFRPFGSPGHQTVKKFLGACHVHTSMRGLIPLVCCGDEIAWIPGLRAGEMLRINPDEPRVRVTCALSSNQTTYPGIHMLAAGLELLAFLKHDTDGQRMS